MDYSLPEINLNLEFLRKIIKSRALLYFVVFVFFLKVIIFAVSLNFSQNIFFADITKIALENLTNQVRQEFNLNPLTDNKKLDQAAMMKAENMIQNNYFNHTSPSGVTPWHWFAEAGYDYKYAGENLAIGFFESEEVFRAWMNSPTHKENLVNPNYKETGIAVLRGFGGNNAIVVVQLFGTEKVKTVSANQNNAQAAKPVQEIKVVNETKPENQSVVSGTRVLSESIKSKTMLEVAGDSVNNLKARILNYVIYNYENIANAIVYSAILLIIMVMALAMALSQAKMDRAMVLRCALMLALLSLSAVMGSNTAAVIIPHQILI